MDERRRKKGRRRGRSNEPDESTVEVKVGNRGYDGVNVEIDDRQAGE